MQTEYKNEDCGWPLPLLTYKYILILNYQLTDPNTCLILTVLFEIQNESLISRNSMNPVGLGQNMEFQAQKVQTINIKASKSLNYKTQKMKIKYECRTDNIVFFYFNAE